MSDHAATWDGLIGRNGCLGDTPVELVKAGKADRVIAYLAQAAANRRARA